MADVGSVPEEFIPLKESSSRRQESKLYHICSSARDGDTSVHKVTDGADLHEEFIPFNESRTSKEKIKLRDNSDDEVEVPKRRTLVYGLTDMPSPYVLLLYGFQIAMQKIEPCVTISVFISAAICASQEITTKLISTQALTVGLCTFLQNLIGVRLPLFQGPALSMMVPLFSFAESLVCESTSAKIVGNSSINSTQDRNDADTATLSAIQMASGAIMGASAIHTMLGVTGLAGKMAPFFGPLTISPALIVIVIYIAKVILEFSQIHFGVAVFTGVLALVLTSYVGHVGIPCPTWTKSSGFRVERYPLLRTFSTLISIGLGWLLCHILTITGTVTNDPTSPQYEIRTDRPTTILYNTPWFYVPYPGQFGPPSFHLGLFAGFCICMMTSVVDSIADYAFASRVCQVPLPPPHAINRGLMVEGASSILSGAFGACGATVTYTGSIGHLALTGVASRSVFVAAGLILMAFGMVGKLGAVFVNIPKPVLGGYICVGLSSGAGVALSAINEVDMKQPRNISALGIAIALGFMLPPWVKKNKTALETGIPALDQIILSLTGNPMFMAGFIGCFLDNTLPGQSKTIDTSVVQRYSHSLKDGKYDMYRLPILNDFFLKQPWTKYMPFLPAYKK